MSVRFCVYFFGQVKNQFSLIDKFCCFLHSKKFSRKYRHLSSDNQRNSANVQDRKNSLYRATASEITIQVTEEHADMNGRLEITCIATIPDFVQPGEQYADYKTFSIKSKFLIEEF